VAALATPPRLLDLVLVGKEATGEDRVVTVVLAGREVMVVLEGTIALIEEGMGVIVPKATSTPTRSSIPKTQSHREQITSP